MEKFSFVVNNIVVNELELLNSFVSDNVDAVIELNEIKNKLLELEHKLRFKKANK